MLTSGHYKLFWRALENRFSYSSHRT
jgi:hypothetical protein